MRWDNTDVDLPQSDLGWWIYKTLALRELHEKLPRCPLELFICNFIPETLQVS